MLIVFPLQQWSQERASMLRLYVHCLECLCPEICTEYFSSYPSNGGSLDFRQHCNRHVMGSLELMHVVAKLTLFFPSQSKYYIYTFPVLSALVSKIPLPSTSFPSPFVTV
jgi:hypothetical protein